MNFKKLVTSLTVLAASLLGMLNVTQAKADDTTSVAINSIAKQNSYVGVTYLYKMLATENITYNKFYAKNKIVYRNNGKPEGIVIHETGDPDATAYDEAIYFNREWNTMYAYVHAFVDHSQVIQMMTPNYGVWGAGPMANDRFVQIELCEETTRDYFAKSVNNDAIWCAKILHRYNLKPINACSTGEGTIWSHAAVSKFLGGTTHGDPDGYFAKWGYSMDQFFELIKYYYDLQAAKTNTASTSNKVTVKATSTASAASNIVKIPTAKTSQKVIIHNAAIYNSKGQKVKDKASKMAGTVVTVIKSTTINKKKYYQIATNEYIAVGNVDGTTRTLKHNSYIYDTAGVSDGKTKLMKNSQIKTYGSKVTIAGIKYYTISPTQFVKAQNF